jgi:hypothetical protein
MTDIIEDYEDDDDGDEEAPVERPVPVQPPAGVSGARVLPFRARQGVGAADVTQRAAPAAPEPPAAPQPPPPAAAVAPAPTEAPAPQGEPSSSGDAIVPVQEEMYEEAPRRQISWLPILLGVGMIGIALWLDSRLRRDIAALADEYEDDEGDDVVGDGDDAV